MIRKASGKNCEDTVQVSIQESKNIYFAVGVSSSGKVVRVFLPVPSSELLYEQFSNEFSDFELTDDYQPLVLEIMKIYDGNESSFNLDSVELSLNKSELVRNPINSEFKLRVLEKVLEIPRGEVRTYKEVAESLNSRAWRAVGNALAKNPLPLIIPCHRVVKSDLSLGNYVGGVEMKKRLLKKEGVKINSLRIIRP